MSKIIAPFVIILLLLSVCIFASTFIELQANSKIAKEIKLKVEMLQENKSSYKVSIQLNSTTFTDWNISSISVISAKEVSTSLKFNQIKNSNLTTTETFLINKTEVKDTEIRIVYDHMPPMPNNEYSVPYCPAMYKVKILNFLNITH